jgi:leucyl aminopeptidase
MKCKVSHTDPLSHTCNLLIVGYFKDRVQSPEISRFDSALNGEISALYKRKEFTADLAKTALLSTGGRLPAKRLLLVGLGEKKKTDGERLRQAMGAAIRVVKTIREGSCSILVDEQAGDIPLTAAAMVTGCLLGNYSFDKYKTAANESLPPVNSMTLLIPSRKARAAAERAISDSLVICEAVALARDLVSEPCNVATPTFIAAKAVQTAKDAGFTCQVLEKAEIEQLGMGGLLAVASGSGQPPKCLVLEYTPLGKSVRPVALIGKGVTFDSGGISLKPREGMERMKEDMAGAAAVIGTFAAVARLGLSVNLVGITPLTENLPDGRAYKPGDMITTMAGKTVEIVNTDAEGRMILCDALHYALRFKPQVMIDLATLTGACIVALGTAASGLFGNNERLKKALLRAGETTGEKVWEMPLWDEYGELMKSDLADLKNAGGSEAGSISAAWFLKQFVANTSWAHLDIAGTSWEEKGHHYLPKGGTGVGVRLLVELLREEYAGKEKP